MMSRLKPKAAFIILVLIIFVFNYLSLNYLQIRKDVKRSILINNPQIFCIILTVENNLKNKSKLIFDSWAYKCDKYKFITALSDKYLLKDDNYDSKNAKEINIGFDVLQPPNFTHDTYSNLTFKVFNTFKYIYKRYPNYDFYLKADDDTFVFFDNLKHFLSDKNRSKPVTYGYNFRKFVDFGYHSGGAGYVLSNEAMKRFNEFFKYNYTLDLTYNEDVDVGLLLRKMHVYPEKSIDEFGRERFHPLNIRDHYYNYLPDWLIDYSENPVKTGLGCCSDTSISFHYMDSEEIKKLNSVLKKLQSKYKTSSTVSLKFKDLVEQMFKTTSKNT